MKKMLLEDFVKKWVISDQLNDMELGAKIREWYWLIQEKNDQV